MRARRAQIHEHLQEMGLIIRIPHFWFEFASTYSNLSAARIAKIGAAANVEVVWEPILLGAIFKQQRWNDSPFNIYPQKGQYMWQDMERLWEQTERVNALHVFGAPSFTVSSELNWGNDWFGDAVVWARTGGAQ
jgi:2-hydroxychromene-2-carboxylate isomerase